MLPGCWRALAATRGPGALLPSLRFLIFPRRLACSPPPPGRPHTHPVCVLLPPPRGLGASSPSHSQWACQLYQPPLGFWVCLLYQPPRGVSAVPAAPVFVEGRDRCTSRPRVFGCDRCTSRPGVCPLYQPPPWFSIGRVRCTSRPRVFGCDRCTSRPGVCQLYQPPPLFPGCDRCTSRPGVCPLYQPPPWFSIGRVRCTSRPWGFRVRLLYQPPWGVSAVPAAPFVSRV